MKLQRFKETANAKAPEVFPESSYAGSRRCDIDQMGDPADWCLFSGAVGGDGQHLSDGCVYRISMSGLRFDESGASGALPGFSGGLEDESLHFSHRRSDSYLVRIPLYFLPQTAGLVYPVRGGSLDGPRAVLCMAYDLLFPRRSAYELLRGSSAVAAFCSLEMKPVGFLSRYCTGGESYETGKGRRMRESAEDRKTGYKYGRKMVGKDLNCYCQ